ncbi:MAG TPA: hypothetical protein DCR21_06360, partial [Succinivibrionaceae bacterium]|nr:hypothetical protein [Succinivibrionaceae bacterium]
DALKNEPALLNAIMVGLDEYINASECVTDPVCCMVDYIVSDAVSAYKAEKGENEFFEAGEMNE